LEYHNLDRFKDPKKLRKVMNLFRFSETTTKEEAASRLKKVLEPKIEEIPNFDCWASSRYDIAT